jgi:hypothetical protein
VAHPRLEGLDIKDGAVYPPGYGKTHSANSPPAGKKGLQWFGFPDLWKNKVLRADEIHYCQSMDFITASVKYGSPGFLSNSLYSPEGSFVHAARAGSDV